MKHKILHLTLSKEPFQVMVTGEKRVEFRKPTKWIESRLFNKDGTRKDYDIIKFTNGYGNDKPFFTAIFNGFARSLQRKFKTYSNGLTVDVRPEDYEIYLGDILKKGNLK